MAQVAEVRESHKTAKGSCAEGGPVPDLDDPEHNRAVSERDQLWASLRQLVPEIERLAAGHADGSDRERQLVKLLARIVLSELAFRVEGPDEVT